MIDAEQEVAAREAKALAAVNEAQAHLQAAAASLRRMLSVAGDEDQKRAAKTLLMRLDAVALEPAAKVNERLMHARMQALKARMGITEAALAAQAAAMAELRDVALLKLQLEAELKRQPPSPPPAAPAKIDADPTVWTNEMRGSPRVVLQAAVDYASATNLYTGFTTNISEGGLFIATVERMPIGTHVDLCLQLPTGQLVRALGEVRWFREYNDTTPQVYPGMGVRFLGLSQTDQIVLHQFVAEREPMFFPD